MTPRKTSTEAGELEALLTQKRFGEVLARAQRWIARAPREPVPHEAMARAYFSTGRLQSASDAADRALSMVSSNAALLLLRAICDHRLGRSDEAARRLRRLLDRRPANQVEASVSLAEVLHRAGRHEEFDDFLAKGGAWLADERAAVFAARAMARKDRAAAIELLTKTAGSSKNMVLKRVAGFDAIRMLDADGRYRDAFELAVETHRQTTPVFDIGAIEASIAAQYRLLEKGPTACPAAGPIVTNTALVVGLPRSGTTLLEQMLDRHPMVSGIGEYEGTFLLGESLTELGLLPDNLRGLKASDAATLSAQYLEGAALRRRAGAQWTFDKALAQWRLMPALATVLPGAAFVHIEREPRDCAISMFLSNFHPQTWGLTRDLASIRRVIELERGIVRRAIEVLGLRALTVQYEELVDHPEREMRRVLALLDLPFDSAVLAPEENRRTVLTLSFEQVRRKINRSSIGRWKNYAFAFDASWDALG